MALENYTELKKAVIKWSHRDDLDLLIPDFIDLAETLMMQNDDEILKPRSQEVRAIAVMDDTSRFMALPDRFLSMRRLRIRDDTQYCKLDFRTPNQMNSSEESGLPTRFTVTSQLEFNVIPEKAYDLEMQYLVALSPLSGENQTNNILTDSPNVYLFGALWALFTHIQMDAEAGKYLLLFIEAIKGSNASAKAGRYGPRPVMIPKGRKP
jgi:hypothetical protein